MKAIFKLLIAIIISIAVILLAGYLYFRYMPDKKVSGVAPDYKVSCTEIAMEYEANPEASDKKYIDRIIEVTGKIDEITKDQNNSFVFILREEGSNSGVLCTLSQESDKNVSKYRVGDSVKIKGTCSGMLFEVVLNKCAIVD